jgi:hypothetical protein
VILLRPLCWLLTHEWGNVARVMYADDRLPSYQRYCVRCYKPRWSDR